MCDSRPENDPSMIDKNSQFIENEIEYIREHLIENHPEQNAHLTNDLGVLIGLHSRAHQSVS